MELGEIRHVCSSMGRIVGWGCLDAKILEKDGARVNWQNEDSSFNSGEIPNLASQGR